MFWWKNQSRSSLLWKQNWAYDLTMMYKDWGKILCKQFAKKKKKRQTPCHRGMNKEKKSSYVMGMRNKLKGAYLWHTRTTSNIAFPCGSAAPTMEKKRMQVASFCTLYNAPHVSIWHDVFTMQWQQKRIEDIKVITEKTPLGPLLNFFFQPHTHLCKQTQRWMRLTRK